MPYALHAQTERTPDAFRADCFPGMDCQPKAHLPGMFVNRLERRGREEVLAASKRYPNDAWALCFGYELQEFQPRFDAIIAHEVNNPSHLDSWCVGALLQAFK